MLNSEEISIEDFDYSLPEEKIAKYPLPNRDDTKLLLLNNGTLEDHSFKEISNLLPKDSFLVFNNTKVIPARLYFQKSTGSIIEILCLEAIRDGREVQNGKAHWQCFVGNNKRWREDFLTKQIPYQNTFIELKAFRRQAIENTWIVDFEWDNSDLTFEEILELIGEMPLPPYLNRKTEAADRDRYQTIYAKSQGSVAAPTAGLHFTETIFSELKAKNIETDFVTLHVGAGTFKPVTTSHVSKHVMHAEQVEISKSFLEHLYAKIGQTVIPVGTTSARTLESIYWHGVKILSGKAGNEMDILQWDGKQENVTVSAKESLGAILAEMTKTQQKTLFGKTQLMITPGYRFRIIDGLFTNFHQPKSTLLLLVSAMIGSNWENVYKHALSNNYRFLSYGDCCLLLG